MLYGKNDFIEKLSWAKNIYPTNLTLYTFLMWAFWAIRKGFQCKYDSLGKTIGVIHFDYQ